VIALLQIDVRENVHERDEGTESELPGAGEVFPLEEVVGGDEPEEHRDPVKEEYEEDPGLVDRGVAHQAHHTAAHCTQPPKQLKQNIRHLVLERDVGDGT
jgi:hypothetical protein